MKKTVLALAIALSFASVAQAHEYSATVDNYTVANNRIKYCSSQGDWASLVFLHKDDSKDWSEQGMLDATKEGDDKEKLSDLEDEINLRAVRYVFEHASSLDDAYNGAYAACMDLLTAGDSQVR